jgi:hypothetical protein
MACQISLHVRVAEISREFSLPRGRRVKCGRAWRHLIFLAAALLLGVHASSAQTLPHNIPDFSQDSSRPTVRSVGTGRWADAGTWQGGQVPTANHVVHVDPNHVVTIDTLTATAYTLAVHGTVRFASAADSRLRVTNVMIMGDHGMPSMTTVGHLEMGTAANPIAATRTAEIVVANTPLNAGVSDPEQYGNGILNFGKLTIHGAPITKTFTRVAVEPRAGHTTLTLSEPASGWRAGDRLVLPDTRHMKESETTGSGWINAVNQWEERTVQSISADGRVVTLTQALQYDHLGARDLNNVLNFLPHVGHLTRNAVIRSENATGTRGHLISVHTADTDIRYALFRDLGRTTFKPLNTTTNLIGRYPIHMHHNRGPAVTPANGYQFTLVGNAVDGGSAATQFKWGIAIHNSHYGLIQDNVVYNYNGASIATEDGSESYNVFDHNFALRGMGEPNNAVAEARMAMGTEGVGFWFRGANNYVRNNVAANFQNPTTEAAYGFVYQFIRLGNVSIPTFKGANPAISGQFTTRNGNNMPILQFDDNEAYGAMQGGFTYWWVGSQDPQPYADAKESLIKNLKIWHVYNKAVYHYPSSKITFDGLIIRGKFDSLARCCGNGVYGADYSTKGVIIRNSDIQGMDEGIQFPEAGFGPEPNLTVENSYLRNNSNIQVPTNGSVNGCWMQNKLVVITNTRFDAPPGRSLNNIAMVRDVGYAPECLSKLDEARVYAYNGVATDNFQVYHTSTSVLPRPPSSCTPTTRTGINGLLCPIAALGPVPPTVTMTASPASITTGQSSTLTWSATNATTVSINQSIGGVATSGTRVVSPTATTTYTITATNSVGSVTALATVTVSTTPTPTPTLTLTASPTSITAGGSATLTWSSTNATSVVINQGVGTVATSGTRSVSPTVTTVYTGTATGAGGSATATATVTVSTTTVGPHNKARANAYDDAWQDGPGGWVENARAILGKGTGQVPGLVLWIGDSLTRDPALGAWAQKGNGKTAEDQAITTWMHAGLSPQSVDSIDGFALATPYLCSARSFTVGDGLGSWHFMGSSMPTDTDPTTAKQKLLNCSSYPNALNLRTMLAALQPAQFAIPEVNLDAASPGSFPDFEAMVDLMISKGIVPIIITYTYRTDAAFNNLVDQYNTALVNYARTKKLPLIDFQAEMLARLPFSQWPGRFLADGVHYTKGTTTYPSTTDPYANGGDPATHTTGLALTYNGYGLKGWLGVQKMKEIKALVIDTMTPPPTPPTATLTASPLSVVQGDPSVLTWSTTSATSVTISPNVGTVAASGSVNVNPASTTTYTLSATNGAGTVTSTATVTVTAPPPPPPPGPGPKLVGTQVAGTFSDASGFSSQSHLVYAANSGVWWFFTLTSAADSQGGSNHIVKSYRSSGPDLETATWTPGPDSPGASVSSGFAPQASMGFGRALGVAYINNNPTDVVHAELNMSFNGQDSITAHIRGVVSATAVTWAGWNYVVEPAATWASPRVAVLGVSSGKYVHSAGPNLQQQIDANARKSTNPDLGATWTSGFSSVSVIDNSMINQVNSFAFAPLANNVMLAVYDNGGGQSCGYNCVPPGSETEPRLTNLGFRRSNSNGSWPGVPIGSQGAGDGNVFASNATINQNDWALVPVSNTTIYAFRAKAGGTGIDGASYNAASNSWSLMSPQPPAFAAGQALKAGAGLFGATDGTQVWLFFVNTDAANSILHSRFNGSAWSAWTPVSGTDTGTHNRGFVSGAPIVSANQVGVIWTEGSGPYTVAVASVPVTAAPPPPMPTVALTSSANSIVAGNDVTLTWSSGNASTVTIDPTVGAVAASGSTTLSPSATTTYTATATNVTGTATATVTVTVTAPPPPPPPVVPTAILTANDYSISAGDTVTLTWSTTDATTVSLNNGIGSVAASGNTTVSPTATTSYVLTASNTAGTTTSTITVEVTQTSQGPAFANVGLTAGWATFGQAVPRGAATNGLMVGTFPTQTDVKNRWPDGSIKFAVVSVLATANGTFAIYPATSNGGSFARNPVEASVAFRIAGALYTATLPATASADAWLSGPLVREDRHVVAPVSAGGVAHPFLRVNFDRRSYSDGHSRVDVSVENMLDISGATTVTYDVDVVLNGQTVFAKSAVEHYYLTRWRKMFDTNTLAESEITPDLNAFYQTRALPPYLSLVTNAVNTTDGPAFDILQPGAVLANMPGHGGRPELAPYPDWTARYLVHRNLQQRRFVLAHGDLSGSWPIHVRQAEGAATSGIGAERYVSLDQRPTVWLDVRAQNAGFDYIHGTPLPIREYTSTTPGPGQSPLIPDNAHQPSLAYVPYLLTGDRFYAEEMAFWANYAMLRTSNSNGVRSSAGILESNEVRGFGWALRNLVDAAAYYPDASPMKAHLVEKVTNNLTWLDTYANSQDPITNPFRALWVDRRPEGPGFRGLWEENYLAYAIDRAFHQGFSGGLAHRDAIAKFQLLLFTSEPDYPRLQAAPSVVGVGTSGSGGLIYYRTMSEIWNATASHTRPFAGYYGPEARLNLMIGVTHGWFGAQDAYNYLWPFISVDPIWPAPDLAMRAGWALDYYPGVTPAPPPPAPVPAALISPAPGSVLSSTVVTFSWSAGTGVTSYKLAVGTTQGGAEIYAGTPGTNLVATVSGLPDDGRTVFVRLSSLVNGVWQTVDQSFVAWTAPPPPPTGVPAVLSTPSPGSVLAGTTQTFRWTSGTGVTEYRLAVGTTQGGSQLYAGVATTAVSVTVSGLPSIGVKVWARLSSRINGIWQWADYEFTSYTTPGIIVRQTVKVNGTGKVSAPALTTTVANEILLALVGSSGPTGSKQQVTVAGAGLAWSRARLANTQYGTAEVWWAKVVNPTAGIIVTSTQLVGGHDQSLTVIRLSGASGIGATVQHNAIDEAPRVTITTTRSNSLVFAVGNDSYSATARTLPSGQVMINEWLDTRIADAFWVQTFAGPVVNSGSTVKLYVTAPVKSRWNFAAVEIVR